MIHIIYTAPCVYDPTLRGMAEAYIAYQGGDPRTEAEAYLRQVPQAWIYAVYKEGAFY